MSEEVNYKNFNEEEGRIYRKYIEVIRSGISNGVKFDVACDFITVEDVELRNLIIDDALKIEIAEMHYGKGRSLLDVSKNLGVPMDRLLKATAEMMEDIVNTAREVSQEQSDGSTPLTH
ncbi:MAG: hypothetical protein ABSA46_13650 [Thermodesulfovibrionales bacterium]|jgi:hypothetical protein